MSASAHVQSALAQLTLRDAQARDQLLAALGERGRQGEPARPGRETLIELLRVEDHFQALLRQVKDEFLAQPLEGDLLDAALGVRRLHVEAANSLQRYLRAHESWAADTDREELLPRVIGLAVQAIHGFAKWGRFLGDTSTPWPCKSMHALYLFAEAEGCERIEFAPLPGHSGARTTVLALYLRSLLLERVGDARPPTAQLEAADELLAAWCPAYALRFEGPGEGGWGVDLGSDVGLARVAGAREAGLMRYLDARAMRAQVEALRGGEAAHALAPGDAGALLQVMGALQRSLESTVSQRGEERAIFKDQHVEVTIGLEEIVSRMRRPAEESAPAQQWSVHDLSSTAYGLVAAAEQAEGVRLGELLGLRNQDTRGWIIGSVVRKVAHGEGRALVGIEVLGFHPAAVALGRPGDAGGCGIYLLGRDARGRLDSLVVRPEDVAAAGARVLALGPTRYRIRMNQRVRKGAGWDQVRFGIEGRS